MAVNLTKGQKISLSKDGKALSIIAMGLGWDAAKPKGGFLGRVFGGGQTSIDLDASCLCFDENKNLVENIYFNNLQARDGSILHSGDNRTGDGDGDDETIIVHLEKLNPRIKSLMFVVNSYTGQTFNDVENASCRIYDAKTKQVLAEYNLSEKGSHTGMIMVKAYMHNGEWKVAAIGETVNGRVAADLANRCKTFL